MSKLEFTGVADAKAPSALGIKSVLRGLLISYGFAVILFLILAAVVTYTNFPESAVNVVITVITVLSIIIAGASVARRARTKGWLHGAAMGVLYVVILYLIGAVTLNGLNFGLNVVSMLISGFVFGAFGGIIGINLKKN